MSNMHTVFLNLLSTHDNVTRDIPGNPCNGKSVPHPQDFFDNTSAFVSFG